MEVIADGYEVTYAGYRWNGEGQYSMEHRGRVTVGPVPACSSSRYEAMFCGNPCQHPTHGRRIARPRGSWSGYIADRCRTPAEPWTADGDSGCLQDGEGWTPRCIHQSILVQGPICYRPLVSEVLTSPATERACLEPSGVVAFEGLLGWQPTAAIADSVRSGTDRLRKPTNDRRAEQATEPTEQISVPLRSCIEAVWKMAGACCPPFGAHSESRPP
ncbi:hypothetical protein SNOG_07487 [Parastagonospora nodorum SN15]|uniref:Uncharacterized protein n=1 Tax=Phaeosphaeria nodorum (strain SN15 / ATCC MYA-4574 / FGSC 10173) TaxID=321614 RepID=Q0UL77_PHANO|nr:hypothetical protein SNOG_07487 [Parastagonospora nodorum SN15]EAT84953.1 hypothetical protein SNOG_07487 [Parastagonospora nodorum SN15]